VLYGLGVLACQHRVSARAWAYVVTKDDDGADKCGPVYVWPNYQGFAVNQSMVDSLNMNCEPFTSGPASFQALHRPLMLLPHTGVVLLPHMRAHANSAKVRACLADILSHLQLIWLCKLRRGPG